MKNLNVPKLLGMGAMGVPFALLLLFAVIVRASWPSHSSGMDPTTRFVAWLSVGGIIVALIAVHVVLGIQLMRSRPEGAEPEMEHFDWDRPSRH